MEVITSHDHADFDALASILGAAILHPKALSLLPPRLNRNLRDFLTLYGGELLFLRQEELPRGKIQRLILVDTQSIPTLKGLRSDTQVLFIDHHPLEKKLEPGMSYRGGEVGATATLLVQELMESRRFLSPVQATLLLLGIYEDSGSLTYATTTPQDLQAGAWLLEQGANLEVARDFLQPPLSEAQKWLYSRLLEAAEFHEFQGYTVMISMAEVEEPVEEVSTLAHHLRDLHDPQALFVLVKSQDRIHIVARSSSDSIDVSAITREFGGGGHRRAAAAMVTGQSMPEVWSKLLRLLRERIAPAVTVGQIMSHGVHTVSPQATVAEAEEAMRRWGHEGFPVIDRGKLVGILTRREIDRALHHGLAHEPAVRFMHKGEIFVSPQDSVETLQKIMMDHGLGQVPVLENGKIVGIVTRTDLIKLWGSPQKSHAVEIKKRLEEALPPPLLGVLHQASSIAQETGFNLYLVGGFVRDLLLGLPNLDIDLVVEGDAIALARRLTKTLGGRVHSHAPFGTAKIIFDVDSSPIVPLTFLDFASARTEFYEHPTALPSVERSSIKQDLGRRDFTINTLAISLNEESYGELLDFYEGLRDLEQGVIRVLHNLSFIEDPTRILRGVRLEQRLGFRLEERTQELIQSALPFLRRVSGDRIREELEAIFKEAEPGKILARLQALGILGQIHPALRYTPALDKQFAPLPPTWAKWQEMDCRKPQKEAVETPLALYLALLLPDADVQEAQEAGQRLSVPLATLRTLKEAAELRPKPAQLSKRGLKRSALYRLLAPYTSQALFLLWLTANSKAARSRGELYHRELACVEPILGGDDLQEMGIPRGPIYKKILEALRDARLDRKVKTRRQEALLVERLVKEVK